jgi:hypothetical protein
MARHLLTVYMADEISGKPDSTTATGQSCPSRSLEALLEHPVPPKITGVLHCYVAVAR